VRTCYLPDMHHYPETNLVVSYDTIIGNKRPNKYWHDVSNCRRFFDEFARERKFDPLDPQGWYSVGSKQICTKLVSSSNPVLFGVPYVLKEIGRIIYFGVSWRIEE